MTGSRAGAKSAGPRAASRTMTDPATPLLEARAISKSFAQTRALVGAHLTPASRRRRMRCSGRTGRESRRFPGSISGHVRRDSGEIVYRGRPLDVRSPREALDAGIAMVMQETSSRPISPSSRISSFRILAGRGGYRCSAMRRRAGEILGDLGQEHALRSKRRRETFPRPSASSSRSPRRLRSKPISSFSTSRPPP